MRAAYRSPRQQSAAGKPRTTRASETQRSRHGHIAIAYLLPALVAFAAAQQWFTPGTVVAGGDFAPPIAPPAEYRSHWNQFSTGVGGASFEITSAPYLEGLRAASALGLSEGLFQRLWISGLLAAAAAAVVFFARSCGLGFIAAGAAGFLATFNGYRLVMGVDAISLAALIMAAVLGGLVVRAGRGRLPRAGVAIFALVSGGLGYVFTNPPHLAIVFMWLAACVGIVGLMGGRPALRRVAGFLVRAAPLVALANLWWVVPAVLTVAAPAFNEQFTAARIDDWAWTHARASLANALALNTSWAWAYEEYFPYAPRLERMPLEPLRYVVGALAVLGVVLARGRERRLAIGLAAVAAAGLLVAKGLHPPLADVNRWFYVHAPGFWLFREPSKVLLIVTLAFAVLGGLAVSRLLETKRLPAAVSILLVLFAFGGAVAYAHPLLTGEVTPQERPGLPSTRVRLPAEWRQASAFLNRQPDAGKVLVLPAADFYQLPTTWGYYGVSFTRLLVRHPVLDAAPGGYFSQASGVSELERSVQADLRAGRARDVPPKLRALGVRWMLLRRDIDESFPGREIESAREIADSLRRVPGVNRVLSNRLVTIYSLSKGSELYPAVPVLFAGAKHLVPEALAALPAPAAVVEGRRDQQRLRGVMDDARVVRFGDDVVRKVWVRTDHRGDVRLRLVDPLEVSVAGRRIPPASPDQLHLRGPKETPFMITVGRTTFTIDSPPRGWTLLGGARIGPMGRVGVWELRSREVVPLHDAGPVGDCNSFDDRDLKELGISAELVRQAGRPSLKLSARDHTACVAFPIAEGELRGRYRLRFGYRSYRGSPARVCLWQEGPDRCAALPDLDRGPGWQMLDAALKPALGTRGLSLFLDADAQGGRPTTVAYRDVAVEHYRLVAARRALERLRPVNDISLPLTGPITVRGALSPATDLLSLGPVGDCHRFDDRRLNEVGISVAVRTQAGQRTLRLTARDHAACVTVPVVREPGGRLHVRLGYRTVRGSPARVCLWQEGPDRCASLPELKEGAGWHRLDASVWPSPGTARMQLFLYADGIGEGWTITEYRAVQLAPASSVAFLGLPTTIGSALPSVQYRRLAPWKFRARVEGAERPFMLVATDGYSSGWQLRRVDRDLPEPLHVRVNEYANGWLIPWKGSYDLVIEYGPERYARAARWISLVTLLILAAWILWRRLSPWPRPRPSGA